jgi:hypothetical protein
MRIKSKVERSLGFSRIHYLWYSIILLFPPCHEFGHAAIAVLMGDKVLSFGYWYVKVSHHNVFQDLWQYSGFISVFCIVLWMFLLFKNLGINLSLIYDKKRFDGVEEKI